MLTRSTLAIINKNTLRYPLQVAEKDYLLTLALEHLSHSQLAPVLIFKGGTALHHCHLPQLRFSEDLDFSTNHTPITLEDVRSLFTHHPFFEIKKDFVSPATIKIERLQYIGPLTQPNFLKIEIDYLQNVVLPPQTMDYQNPWGVQLPISVMDLREICAEKIRAMSGRARYRDFYDLTLTLTTHPLDLSEIISLIPRKEVREPISKANILRNWQIVLTQKSQEMNQIYYSHPIPDDTIATLIHSLPITSITPNQI